MNEAKVVGSEEGGPSRSKADQVRKAMTLQIITTPGKSLNGHCIAYG